MFQIGNTVVSRDIIEQKFVCDLKVCKGNCCVYGDSGAPMEQQEIDQIRDNFDQIAPFMQAEGIKSIKKQGFAVKDNDGEWTTPLIDDNECAYCYFDNGIARCAIEKAFQEGKINFRKPISCWLYPIRIARYNSLTALMYHRWNICQSGVVCGSKLGIPLYVFLKEPLIVKFGNEWYNELCLVAKEWKNQQICSTQS